MKRAHPTSPCAAAQQADPTGQRRRGPKRWSPEGLDRLRASAMATRPWELTCGPRTAEGKARSSQNGRVRQRGEKSVRELRAELADVFTLMNEMTEARRSLAR